MTNQQKNQKQEENMIDRGAEAILIKEGQELVKKRVKKGYRHEKLDEKLRKKRTRWEVRNIKRVAGKINVPEILNVDEDDKTIAIIFSSCFWFFC